MKRLKSLIGTKCSGLCFAIVLAVVVPLPQVSCLSDASNKNISDGEPRQLSSKYDVAIFMPQAPLVASEKHSGSGGKELAHKIDSCLAAGINVFIYDWRVLENGDFIENGLCDFFKAPNSERMMFAIVWTNRSAKDFWKMPVPVCDIWGARGIGLNETAEISEHEFRHVLVPRWIEYFKRPNYYKVNGKPLFQVSNPVSLARWFGGPDGVLSNFKYFEKKAIEAGLDGVEFQCALGPMSNPDNAELCFRMGFKSVFCLNWLETVHFSDFEELNLIGKTRLDYKVWGDIFFSIFDSLAKTYPQLQFYPNVSCDILPQIFLQSANGDFVVIGGNRQKFEYFLRKAKLWTDRNISGKKSKLIIIDSLGKSALESGVDSGKQSEYDFLNAVAGVFGSHGQAR